MSDNYNSKSKFSKFLEGKGFYVALAICVVGAGTAAWMAVNKTITRMEPSASSSIAEKNVQEQTYGFPDLEEAGKAQKDIQVPSSSSTPASSSIASSTSTKVQATVSEAGMPSVEAKAQVKEQNSSFVLPISGEIFSPYSAGELVRNETLKEWRTHDGIDIKADKGTPVKAVTDGKVVVVRDDPLMGYTVEVSHAENITSIYCGLDKKVSVKQGDTVKVGQAIGSVGEIPSEITLAPHLHFAMKAKDVWVDPLKTMGKTTK